MWCAVLLGLFCYAGALLCTDLLGREPEFQELYGSVLTSMLTHVKLSLVEAWPDMVTPMVVHSSLWAVYAGAFICVANVALLNAVTGVVCEKVMEVASTVPPLTEEEYNEHLLDFRTRLEQEFHAADEDESYSLDKDEYLKLLCGDEMQGLLQEMNIGLPLDENHLLAIFSRIETTEIKFDEFHRGLLCMRGSRLDHQSSALQYDLRVCIKHLHECITRSRRAIRAGRQIAFERLTDALLLVEGDNRHIMSTSSSMSSSVSSSSCSSSGDASSTATEDAEHSIASPRSLASECLSEVSQPPDIWEPELEDACSELEDCLFALKERAELSLMLASTAVAAAQEPSGQGTLEPRRSCFSVASQTQLAKGERQSSIQQQLPAPEQVLAVSGVLQVHILAVSSLRASDLLCRCECLSPYVIARVGETEQITPTICYSMEQSWDEDNFFSFQIADSRGALELVVMNAMRDEDELLGSWSADLPGLPSGKWNPHKERLQGPSCGELEFVLCFEKCHAKCDRSDGKAPQPTRALPDSLHPAGAASKECCSWHGKASTCPVAEVLVSTPSTPWERSDSWEPEGEDVDVELPKDGGIYDQAVWGAQQGVDLLATPPCDDAMQVLCARPAG
mmetsp:Transcript_72006/g.187010  ORF Transcript_72006/g.187010 Transcript_72006/m.187010 type:complete len:621 (-) Transcript_72006:121-1983(-)